MTILIAAGNSPSSCSKATGKQANIAACWLAHILGVLSPSLGGW